MSANPLTNMSKYDGSPHLQQKQIEIEATATKRERLVPIWSARAPAHNGEKLGEEVQAMHNTMQHNTDEEVQCKGEERRYNARRSNYTAAPSVSSL